MAERNDVLPRRDALKMLAAGALAAGATVALGVSGARPALAAQRRAVVVNTPRGRRGQYVTIELRVFEGSKNVSSDVYQEITARHRCHVNCWSRSDGYSTRRDAVGVWPQWYGDRIAFTFLCSGRTQDDNIYCWFAFMDSSNPNGNPMFSCDPIRVALG